jgi:hypothetical protein
MSEDANGRSDLWVLPLEGDREPIPFLRTEFDEGEGVFSPDMRWIAYVSNESGTREVYVQPFPITGGKWQVSTNGGQQPRWRSDGKELFYLTARGSVMAVGVKGESAVFEKGGPRLLFETGFTRAPSLWGVKTYDVTANGERFLTLRERTSDPVTVVLNWASELEQ